MSKRFAIRSTRPAEQKDGARIIYGTGEQVPFNHSLVLHGKKFGDKETEFEFVTGLEPKHIKHNVFYEGDKETQEALLKEQAEDVEMLGQVYGKDRLKSTDSYFWNDKGPMVINNETLTTFFDKKIADHTILYWKIIGGGYADSIAPSYEGAQQFGLPFFLTELEEQAERETEDISAKGKAYSLLEELAEKKSPEDLLWVSWMVLPVMYGGYTKKTAKATLYKANYQFIEGILVKKSKKQCAKIFIEAVSLLKKDKTKAISQACVRAGDHFGLLFINKEGKYQVRSSNLILGDTIEDSIEILLKPINQQDLETLKNEVEEKLK